MMNLHGTNMTGSLSNIALEISKPTTKGNYICIKVDEWALKKRLEMCQYSLIGRVFLSKRDSSWKLADLREKLQSLWKLSSAWHLISLGKGFFYILLFRKKKRTEFGAWVL
ncbi:hypothetical protein TorRG33x02_228040 [Trema orientale]|uniref:DUF4283 domain-containing protein n=1 Tax=Trema orientale TaxID=63057 RepID=A0A2P5E753_TREOI|nr:hypothetical protein TorRG33x02_228040 [Trema orientale]